MNEYKPIYTNGDNTTPTELETVTEWKLGETSGTTTKGKFDFEDGKDNGTRRGVMANFNADFTEIDAEIARINNKIEQQKAKAKNKIKALKDYKKQLANNNNDNGNSIANSDNS